MGRTRNLGWRIELLPMDKFCHDISLGLYRQIVDGVPRYLVHTYSSAEGARERIGFITRALLIMAGMEEVPDAPGWVRFACSGTHERALRRGFLDLCKLETGAPLEPKPLSVFDKKAECELVIKGLGQGIYAILTAQETPKGRDRATALARGFEKVCEMQGVDGAEIRVGFACRESHDSLMGLLAFRAQNVRASMREEEAAASRGILAAPSQQKT